MQQVSYIYIYISRDKSFVMDVNIVVYVLYVIIFSETYSLELYKLHDSLYFVILHAQVINFRLSILYAFHSSLPH